MKLSKKSGLRRWVAFLLTLCLIFSSVPAGLAAEEDRQPVPDEQALPTESPAGEEGEDSVPLLPPEGEKPDSAVQPEGSEEAAADVEPPLTEEESEKALSMPETEGEKQIEKGASSLPEGAGVEQEGEAEQAPALLTLDSDEAEEARRALGEQIARVTGDKAADWYQTDDRFNGKESSGQGFWTDLQPILAAARELYDKPGVGQEQLASMTEQLSAAIDRLIPASCANGTGLYETLLRCRKYEEGYYTSLTWSVFSDELKRAEACLSAMYDQAGLPTEANTASAQPELDTREAALTQAELGLLRIGTREDFERFALLYRGAAEWLTGQTLKQTDYTADSWAAWEAAKAEMLSCMDAGCDSDAKIVAYLSALEAANRAYYGLTAAQDTARVHVRVADSFSLLYPDLALTDAATITYDGTVALTGDKSAAALFAAIGFNGSQKENSATYGAEYYLYINGTLAAQRGGQSPGNWGSDYRSHAFIQSLQLHDGDEVVLSIADTPSYMYYIHRGGAPYYSYYKYAGLLEIAGRDQVLEVEAGSPFTLSVSQKTGAPETAFSVRPAPKADLYLSEVQPTREAAQQTPAVKPMELQTDSSGSAAPVIYTEGWYRLAVAITIPQTTGSMSVDDSYVSGGVYENLPAADYLLVHVVPSSDDSAVREALERELEGVYRRYDRDFYTPSQWQELTAIYTSAVLAVESSALLGDAFSSQKAALGRMGSMIQEVEQGHTKQREDIVYLLKGLPEDTVYFTAYYAQRYERLNQIIGELSPYMKGSLTQGQQAKYERLKNAYDACGGQLPEGRKYRVYTVLDGDGSAFQTGQSVTYNVTFSNPIEDRTYYNKHYGTAELTEQEMIPGSLVNLTYYDTRVKSADDRPETEITAITVTGAAEWKHTSYESYSSDWHDGRQYYFNNYLAFTMPDGDVTIHLRVAPVVREETDPAEELEAARVKALQQLEDLLATYEGEECSTQTWGRLQAAKARGMAALQAAANREELAAALKEATETLLLLGQQETVDLPEDFGDLVGRVYVSVANTTYPEGNQPFEYYLEMADENVFLAGWYDLYEKDTMMTTVLKALAAKGLSWTGTGGSQYSITYLSSIYVDVNGNGSPDDDEPCLAEFDGGQGSGWMGTLNDWFTNYGFQEFSVENGELHNGDTIQIQYTTDLGVDLDGSFNSADTKLKDLAIEGGTLSPAFDGSTRVYTLQPDVGCSSVRVTPRAANKNYLVKAFLNQYDRDDAFYRRTESIPVKAGDVLYIGCGEYKWPSMNNQTDDAIHYSGTKYTIYVVADDGAAVDQLADLLPSAKELTFENYSSYADRIQELYEAYRKLTEDEQQALTNRDKLLALKEKADRYAAVDEVKAAMAALPTREDWTDGDKPALQALLEDYQALPEENRLECMTVHEAELAAAMEDYLKAVNYGDLNGDGYINLKDIILLKRYVANYKVEIDLAAADVNVDSYINLKDIILLKRFVANYPVTLGKQA